MICDGYVQENEPEAEAAAAGTETGTAGAERAAAGNGGAELGEEDADMAAALAMSLEENEPGTSSAEVRTITIYRARQQFTHLPGRIGFVFALLSKIRLSDVSLHSEQATASYCPMNRSGMTELANNMRSCFFPARFELVASLNCEWVQ